MVNDITEKEYIKVLEYFNLKKGIKHTEVCDAINECAVGSVSDTCIIPIQDHLHQTTTAQNEHTVHNR